MTFLLADEDRWPRIYTDLDTLDIEPLLANGELKTSELQWGRHAEPISLRRLVVSYRPMRRRNAKIPNLPVDLGDWIARRARYAATSIRIPKSEPYWDTAICSSIQAGSLTIADVRPSDHEPDLLNLDDLKVAIRVLCEDVVQLTSYQVGDAVEALIERDILRPDFATDAPVLDPTRYVVVVKLHESGEIGDFLVLNAALREAIDGDRIEPGWSRCMEGRPDNTCYFHFSSLIPILDLFLDFMEVRCAAAGSIQGEDRVRFYRERQAAVRDFLGVPAACRICFRPRRSGRWLSRCPDCHELYGGKQLPTPFVSPRKRRRTGE